MATLEIQNMPDELIEEIRRRAIAHGLSIEQQVVHDLAAMTPNPPERSDTDEEALLEEIRRERDALTAKGVYLTEEYLQQAKTWGRK